MPDFGYVCVGGCGLLVGFGLVAWAIWRMFNHGQKGESR